MNDKTVNNVKQEQKKYKALLTTVSRDQCYRVMRVSVGKDVFSCFLQFDFRYLTATLPANIRLDEDVLKTS